MHSTSSSFTKSSGEELNQDIHSSSSSSSSLDGVGEDQIIPIQSKIQNSLDLLLLEASTSFFLEK